MNNIHQVIFNKTTQQSVVVSELAKSAGKPKSVSADTVDIVSVLRNFSEKRPLVGDIQNHSELKTRSVAVSGGTSGFNPMSALSLLGNKNESTSSTTKAAVGENIGIVLTNDSNAESTLSKLNRDTANANQKVNKHDITEVQETQALIKGIGEIATKAYQIYTHSEREAVEQAKLELGKAKSQNASKEEIGQLEANLDRLQSDYDKAYGTGSSKKRALDAVTAALQGLAAKDIGQAAVGLASPYLNEQIKELTQDDTQANLIAHALLQDKGSLLSILGRLSSLPK